MRGKSEIGVVAEASLRTLREYLLIFLIPGEEWRTSSTFTKNTDCKKDQASEGIVFFGWGKWSLGGAISKHSDFMIPSLPTGR